MHQKVIVTVGATEGLYSSITALINPGDEVIIFEPFYDTYPLNVILAGAKPVYIPLKPPSRVFSPLFFVIWFTLSIKDHKRIGELSSAAEWRLDINELKRAVTSKTRMLVINNPMNVPGKSWTFDELATIADIARKHNLIVLRYTSFIWFICAIFDNFVR
jgi:aspartate/methionine/tyrosine aminotransferase